MWLSSVLEVAHVKRAQVACAFENVKSLMANENIDKMTLQRVQEKTVKPWFCYSLQLACGNKILEKS